jgi:trehalose 6-phosphate synthase/phosphatase
LDDHYFSEKEKRSLEINLKDHNCIPIFPDVSDYQKHLHGFSKNTLWPLFHYFTENTDYNHENWEAYIKVNQQYADTICELMEPGDTLWIHDYHLLLLPKMVRQIRPDISVGLFVHIPFPSFEIFRLLPWREEILEGMLGADLIGFHIFDYVRHFMSCVRRLTGLDTIFNRIAIGERDIKVDAFPKGIDYNLFATKQTLAKGSHSIEDKQVNNQIESYFSSTNRKFILSIDPLDYTKGIPQRLLAFELFLKNNPDYHEKVCLLLIALQSGEKGKSYGRIKRRTDELVGRLNGEYGNISWTPVIYTNQEYTVDQLITLYSNCEIGLILPYRDGMNLVAKEFVAAKKDGNGVLILSELAGASKELHEALLVNPNSLQNIADAIRLAIEMPEGEQRRRLEVMQNRLRRYPLTRWANEFVQSLEVVKQGQQKNLTRKIDGERLEKITNRYKSSSNRILLLDYDGTLSEFKKNPMDAIPDKELQKIINGLTSDKKNSVVIISGRDKKTLGEWFPDVGGITLIAEHGVWLRESGREWAMMEQVENGWKKSIEPLLEYYVDQTPKSFIEDKNFSLVWHFRKSDPDLGIQRSWELKEQLRNLTANLNLEIMDGDKVLEIKYSGINKGKAALTKMAGKSYDFIFAIGDDWTDEFTFDAMPEEAFTVKVGTKSTKAIYYIDSVQSVREMLSGFISNRPV